MIEKTLVSICCICYNQEQYIRQALDGFVMQQTTFPFEVVISDDCSKDDTRKIIAEYKEKYPNVIRDISPEKNKGSMSNWWYVQDCAKGKYVAICEGDDYWTDPLKLQKQVDFLESHPDFSMCCHAAKVLNETTRTVDTACERMATREYFPKDAFPKWQIPTASIVYRKEPVMSYPIRYTEDFVAGDVVLILRCMHVGRVWGMEDKMSVYRMNPGGATSQPETDALHLRMCKHYEALMLNFPKLDRTYPNLYIASIYYSHIKLDKGIINKLKALWIAFSHSPQLLLKKMLRMKTMNTRELYNKFCIYE